MKSEFKNVDYFDMTLNNLKALEQANYNANIIVPKLRQIDRMTDLQIHNYFRIEKRKNISSIDDFCIHYKASRSQLEIDTKKGKNLGSSFMFDKTGCYKCDGYDSNCKSYEPYKIFDMRKYNVEEIAKKNKNDK